MILSELARQLGCRLEGDGSIDITGVAGLDQAGPGQLTFFGNPKLRPQLEATRASAVIMPEDAAGVAAADAAHGASVFRVRARAGSAAPAAETGAGHQPARIDRGRRAARRRRVDRPVRGDCLRRAIGARTILHSHVTVGLGTSIGEDCMLHSHVAVREGVTIGHRVTVQNGAVIGSDGFGFTPGPDGEHHHIPQVGTVIIEDDVDIGANTTIDRASIGATRIAKGTKIDNLVQIGHSVKIGRRVLLAAQVGLAGSTTLEDDVMLGGQVGAAGHLTIGKGAKVTAQSGISNSLDAGTLSSGYPAIDNGNWRKSSIIFAKLPELRRQLIRLEERLAALEEPSERQ